MLKRISLNKQLLKAYHSSLEHDKIQSAQVCSLAGIIVFIASIFMEMTGFFPVLSETQVIRFSLIAVLMASFASTLYESIFIKFYGTILTVTFITVSFLIEYAVYISTPFQYAYHTYFSTLMIVIVILYTWTYLSFKYLIFITLVIISGYALAILSNAEQHSEEHLAFLLVTLSKLLGAVLLSFIGKFIRDQHLYKSFLLQQSFKDLFEEKAKESDKHKHHATHDTLTNLPNRRYIEDNLIQRLSKIQAQKKIMVIMFLDLNGFKKINDDFGHDAGDVVLKVTANRLVPFLNNDDRLVRLGGDEFLMCFAIDDSDTQKIIENILEKVRITIAEAIIFKDQELTVTTSIGVATSNKDGYDIDKLIAAADKRMYEDKIIRKETRN